MRKIFAVLFALVGATACSVQSETPVVNINEGTITNVITVSGTGEVAGVPDVLVVDFGVSVLRPTVDVATSDAASLANAIIEAVKAKGVAERDIQTASYSIYAEYDYRNDDRTILGYRVGNVLTLKVRQIDKAGEVIDAAVAAGGNDAVVNGIRFDLENNQELVKAARDAAWADASAKATQLAGLAELELGKALTISESTSTAPPIIYERAVAAASDGSTPIQAGEQTVTVVLQVQFSVSG